MINKFKIYNEIHNDPYNKSDYESDNYKYNKKSYFYLI